MRQELERKRGRKGEAMNEPTTETLARRLDRLEYEVATSMLAIIGASKWHVNISKALLVLLAKKGILNVEELEWAVKEMAAADMVDASVRDPEEERLKEMEEQLDLVIKIYEDKMRAYEAEQERKRREEGAQGGEEEK